MLNWVDCPLWTTAEHGERMDEVSVLLTKGSGLSMTHQDDHSYLYMDFCYVHLLYYIYHISASRQQRNVATAMYKV